MTDDFVGRLGIITYRILVRPDHCAGVFCGRVRVLDREILRVWSQVSQ